MNFKESFEKELELRINNILNDKLKLEYFLKYNNNLSLDLSKISYELLIKIINKMQVNNLKYDNKAFANVSKENQYRILKEKNISDNILISLIEVFSNEVKSHFFMNDSRALYLFNKFNIQNLIKSGIVFSDDILKKEEFFDLLKSKSFIQFRYNINSIEKHNNPIIIEERLNKYYDELISKYLNNNLFEDYKFILYNPKLIFEYNKFNYLFDDRVVEKINLHIKYNAGQTYIENIEQLIDFLKEETNKKLSEIIIDALFRDNIYNVWVNIKQMLRYNNLLTEEEKILDSEKIKFYKMIIDFDRISCMDKIDIYNKLKNKNYNLIFYQDLRQIKDLAYKKIKNDLINPYIHPEYIDKKSTNKYGVDVYDLRDKSYIMLVRTQPKFKEKHHYRRGCYSIISSENTLVFASQDLNSFTYGYISFDNDTIIHMYENDSYSFRLKEQDNKYPNRIMTSNEIVNASNSYNEIQIANLKSDKGKYLYEVKKPDFLVVFDIVLEKHIIESKRLNIPICVITKKKLNQEKKYNIDSDMYVYYDLYSEKEKRTMR